MPNQTVIEANNLLVYMNLRRRFQLQLLCLIRVIKVLLGNSIYCGVNFRGLLLTKTTSRTIVRKEKISSQNMAQ